MVTLKLCLQSQIRLGKCFPVSLLFFFPFASVLYIGLPISKDSTLRQYSSVAPQETVLKFQKEAQPNIEIFAEQQQIEQEPEGNVCHQPILKPDGSSMPEAGLALKPCTQQNHLNPFFLDVVEFNDNGRRVNRTILRPNAPWAKDRQHSDAINCTYARIRMKDDFSVEFESTLHLLKRLPAFCPSEIIQLNCSYPALTENDGTSLPVNEYDWRWDTFSNVIRCMIVNKRRFLPPTTSPPWKRIDERLNIIMIGLDSLSKVTWMDQLPRSTEYFKEIGGLTLEGYNIVGDGTTLNLLALLAGHFYGELHEARRGYPNASYVDNFPFIFKDLERYSNYVTLFDEDQPSIGTFQNRLMGFKEKPTVYYGRGFQLAFQMMSPRHFDCIGSQATFEEMINQVQNLFSLHPDPQPKFAFIFNGAHSRPTFQGTQDVTHLDSIIFENLQQLKQSGVMENSLVVLFSDHGARNGRRRATSRGKIEERMPYFSLRFPDWFKKKYFNEFENAEVAAKRLTTPFDIYRTLQVVGGVDGVSSATRPPNRGLSLFESIPSSRDCASAGISPHWCTCHMEEQVPSNLVLEEIDGIPISEFLSAFDKFSASMLSLVSDQCEAIKASSPFMSTNIAGNYLQISFYTEPGHGQWEVTFRVTVNSHQKRIEVADSSQVSRTNSYGPAPYCIRETHPHLREFCYCKGLSERLKSN